MKAILVVILVGYLAYAQAEEASPRLRPGQLKDSSLCFWCKALPTGEVCAANDYVNPYKETLLNSCWVHCNKLGEVRHSGACCGENMMWCGSLKKCVGIDEDCCEQDSDCGLFGKKCCKGKVAPEELKGLTKRGRFANTCESSCEDENCMLHGGCKCSMDRDCVKGQYCCSGTCTNEGTDCCNHDANCATGERCCDESVITDALAGGRQIRVPRKCRKACIKPMSLVSGQDKCRDSEECGDADWHCHACVGHEHDMSVHCCNYMPQRFTLNNLV